MTAVTITDAFDPALTVTVDGLVVTLSDGVRRSVAHLTPDEVDRLTTVPDESPRPTGATVRSSLHVVVTRRSDGSPTVLVTDGLIGLIRPAICFGDDARALLSALSMTVPTEEPA